MNIYDLLPKLQKPQRNQGVAEKYDVFISYRRDGGESTAKMMYDKLLQLGYRVFFDVESLRNGLFNVKLYSVIDECKDVVLILSPEALDRCESEDDWVRQEVEYALQKGKNVVPIMLRGFDFPEKLPQNMENLRYMNGLQASLEYFDAFVDKVQSFLLSKPVPVEPPHKKVIACVSVVVVIVLIIGIAFYGRKDSKTESVTADSIEDDNLSATTSNGQEVWESGGVIYTGIKVDGVIDGYGKAQYEDGYYEGDWVNGKRAGNGVFYWNNGTRYEGEWENDKQQGTGTEYYINGDYYEGEWEDNQRQGTGIYYWVNGDRYEGEWANGQRQGTGTYYSATGIRFEGEYENDKQQGAGTEYYINGDYFEGEWKDGQRQGRGVYYWANGDRHEGEYENNMAQGPGTVYYADGNRLEAVYKDSKLDGVSYLIKTDGSIVKYVNEMGVLVSEENVEKWSVGSGADEITYYGNRVNGVIEGEGRAIYNDGYYEGEWENGQRQGTGTYYYADGTVKSGTWENDTYIGE